MNDFRQLSWDEVLAMHRAAEAEFKPVEDAEFTVEEPDAERPEWQVWAETYPWREADARQYLVFEAESHDVYWYRDRRDGRPYGMPSLQLVRAAHDRFAREGVRAAKRWTYALRWLGVYLVLSVGLVGAFGPPVVWSWLALPVLALWFARRRRKAATINYMRLAEARFDEFLSDQERIDRRNELIATGAVVGGYVAYKAVRHHMHHLHED